MKIDLDELEREARSCVELGTHVVLALIVRIRELEVALAGEASTLSKGFVGEAADERQDAVNMANRMIGIAAKGVVLP